MRARRFADYRRQQQMVEARTQTPLAVEPARNRDGAGIVMDIVETEGDTVRSIRCVRGHDARTLRSDGRHARREQIPRHDARVLRDRIAIASRRQQRLGAQP